MALAATLASCGGRTPSSASSARAAVARGASTPAASGGSAPTGPARPRQPAKPGPPFAVGERVVTFVDHSRTVQYPGQGRTPRTLVTVVRYPVSGPPSRIDAMNARPLRAGGPYPLLIFGHGYAVTPGTYTPLLRAWARAGYVVAAPVFPLENEGAPGGPNESDLPNQPADMSFVITQMLVANGVPGGFFSGLLAPHRIAVSGQSDGGDTALTAAYNSHFRDRRITAAVILSGQEMPGVSGYDFPAPSPPLLATQGLADTINLPATTYQFFDPAPSPKYLLTMPGAPHLPPYTSEQPQLSIVERVSTAFLDHYLKGYPRALKRMAAAAGPPSVARLQADPRP